MISFIKPSNLNILYQGAVYLETSTNGSSPLIQYFYSENIELSVQTKFSKVETGNRFDIFMITR